MRFRAHQEAAQLSTRGLLALFALALLLLVFAVNAVMALAWWATVPIARDYPAWFFETNTAFTLLYVLGGCWFESLRLRQGGAHVARMAGGRPAQPDGGRPADHRLERRYVNIVHEMALAARWPAPAAWVLPNDDAINAFAAGWSADDAVVAVTRGALERLTREELQGVVAHEFSHLVHGDTRLNMRLIGLVWGLQMIFTLGRLLATPVADGRRPATTPFGIALMVAGSLGWAAGRLLQAAVSRQREFLADASAVRYTRLVKGIGGALRKIADQRRHQAHRLRSAEAATLTHLMLASPGTRSRWWSTHPPVAERLRRLYGRDPGVLAADVLPPPEHAEAPVIALAPLARAPQSTGAGAGAGAGTGAGGAGAAGAGPEAHRHDPLQRAALDAAAQRERLALQRIERWHGPGQLAAALLALVAAPVDGASWAAATKHPPAADAVRVEIEALGPQARLKVLASLARRAAAAPRARRLALQSAAATLARTDTARLRWLTLRHLMSPCRPPPGRAMLAAMEADVQQVSAHLAPWLAPAEAEAWRSRVRAALALQARDGATPDPSAALRAAWRLRRRLGMMQRPRLWRAWLEATSAPHDDGQREVLALAAVLLDLPV